MRFFRWLPPLEFVAFSVDPAENLKQLVWPTLAQAYYISAPIMRLTRSQMLEVVRQDYVRTARAKGLADRAVVYRHALGNSLLPVVTFVGWWGGRLLGGIVIMEIIFAVPGMGTALVQAVSNRDYPTVQAIVFVMALDLPDAQPPRRPALRLARSRASGMPEWPSGNRRRAPDVEACGRAPPAGRGADPSIGFAGSSSASRWAPSVP